MNPAENLRPAPRMAEKTAGPADLALTFTSPFDGSDQPYRLYLPTAHDGARAVPLLVALHGTGGDENKYFDHEVYQHGLYKKEAEKRGWAVLCPRGNDSLGRPTEWRGVGELHVLAAIEDACRRFRLDCQRIVCTGQSMGGTGTTYLCCRYPDVFAAGIPLASTYGHVSLVANLRHVPIFFVQGEDDWPVYAETGPVPLTEEMHRLGYNGELWMVPDAGHNTMAVSTSRVFDWAEQHQRVAHPRHITHRAYFAPHGRAWWVEIKEIERIGWFAEVDARAEGNAIRLALHNVRQIVLRPEPEVFDLSAPIHVFLDEKTVCSGNCAADEEILLSHRDGQWCAETRPRQLPPRTEWRDCVVGVVDQAPDWQGEPEAALGNWLTDAMRDITGADIAIGNKGHYRYGDHFRGAPVQAGQTVTLIDMINWLRPGECALAAFTLSGAELLAIIEDNIRDAPEEAHFVIQVSGCRYRFDRRRPFGQRVVDSDVQPERRYKVVCKSSAITRTDTMHLAGLRGQFPYEVLEPNVLSTACRYIHKHQGRISARLEGRVSEVYES